MLSTLGGCRQPNALRPVCVPPYLLLTPARRCLRGGREGAWELQLAVRPLQARACWCRRALIAKLLWLQQGGNANAASREGEIGHAQGHRISKGGLGVGRVPGGAWFAREGEASRNGAQQEGRQRQGQQGRGGQHEQPQPGRALRQRHLRCGQAAHPPH